MKINSIHRTAALFVALAMVVPFFAKPLTKTINISQPAKVGKASLEAGEYQLSIDGTKATVQKARTLWLKAKAAGRARSQIRIHVHPCRENGQIREVRFAGKRKFLFSANNEPRSQSDSTLDREISLARGFPLHPRYSYECGP